MPPTTKLMGVNVLLRHQERIKTNIKTIPIIVRNTPSNKLPIEYIRILTNAPISFINSAYRNLQIRHFH